MAIKLLDYAYLQISHCYALTFLRMLKQNIEELVIKEERKFINNPLLIFESGEHVTLIMKEYPKATKTEKETHHMRVNVGVYKTSND